MKDKSIIQLYKTDKGVVKVLIQGENVWMTQEQIWELFWKDRSVISKHISNIYSERELQELDTIWLNSGNVQNIHIGLNKPTKHYNLDLVFAVGYRVRSSEQAIAFRNWATSVLKEFAMRWFVMDDKRLEEWNTIGWKIDFDTLIERVRAIRFSEKQIYEKIKDIFRDTSIDYDSKSQDTQDFFARIQNKFVYAITWHTTAELIFKRVNADKPALWMKGAKKDHITKWEATIWKNYLLEKELKQLYLLCEQFFSFAELQLSLERTLTMKDWIHQLDEILRMNKLDILDWAGKVSKTKMEDQVAEEMKKYQDKWGSLDIYIETIEEMKKLSSPQI